MCGHKALTSSVLTTSDCASDPSGPPARAKSELKEGLCLRATRWDPELRGPVALPPRTSCQWAGLKALLREVWVFPTEGSSTLPPTWEACVAGVPR